MFYRVRFAAEFLYFSQSRSATRTRFGYAVGAGAAILAAHSLNGYFVSVTGVYGDVSQLRVRGLFFAICFPLMLV
jgi:hypothetical protein